MRGIILAGGKGTRLYPITQAVCKQLLPIYDKPLIYYPLSVLLQSNIREILIISTPEATPMLERLLGDGSRLGIAIQYAVQEEPRGIADAFLIGESFIGNDEVCLILGDNIFFGNGLTQKLQAAAQKNKGATVFGYYVKDPERYGILEFDTEKRVQQIVEKPQQPASHWAVTGLYFYDSRVVSFAKELKPSARGELEITDINNRYLQEGELHVECLETGYAWLDTGTFEAFVDAAMFIKTIEDRQGLKIGCIEEWAYRMDFINEVALQEITATIGGNYGAYLSKLSQQL